MPWHSLLSLIHFIHFICIVLVSHLFLFKCVRCPFFLPVPSFLPSMCHGCNCCIGRGCCRGRGGGCTRGGCITRGRGCCTRSNLVCCSSLSSCPPSPPYNRSSSVPLPLHTSPFNPILESSLQFIDCDGSNPICCRERRKPGFLPLPTTSR